MMRGAAASTRIRRYWPLAGFRVTTARFMIIFQTVPLLSALFAVTLVSATKALNAASMQSVLVNWFAAGNWTTWTATGDFRQLPKLQNSIGAQFSST